MHLYWCWHSGGWVCRVGVCTYEIWKCQPEFNSNYWTRTYLVLHRGNGAIVRHVIIIMTFPCLWFECGRWFMYFRDLFMFMLPNHRTPHQTAYMRWLFHFENIDLLVHCQLQFHAWRRRNEMDSQNTGFDMTNKSIEQCSTFDFCQENSLQTPAAILDFNRNSWQETWANKRRLDSMNWQEIIMIRERTLSWHVIPLALYHPLSHFSSSLYSFIYLIPCPCI